MKWLFAFVLVFLGCNTVEVEKFPENERIRVVEKVYHGQLNGPMFTIILKDIQTEKEYVVVHLNGHVAMCQLECVDRLAIPKITARVKDYHEEK